jgi:YVTN family beta-propeller protein
MCHCDELREEAVEAQAQPGPAPSRALRAMTGSVSAQPSGIAVNAALELVYVPNFGDGTLSLIDAVPNTVRSTVPVGAEPSTIAVNPNIGTSGHIFATTAASDGGWDKFLLLPEGRPAYFARPHALGLKEPREGIAFDPGRKQVSATSRAGSLLAVYQDGEPACATNSLAPARLLLEVCVAAPGGQCQERFLR